jgi:hypothetical protein
MTATRRRTPAAGRRVYVLYRHVIGAEGLYFETDDGGDEVAVPVKGFASKPAAEAERAAREAEARQLVEPFPLAIEATGLPKGGIPAIARTAKRHGLDATKCTTAGYQKDGLAGWWRSQSAKATPEARAALWGLFPKVAFYRLGETALED